MKTTLKTKKNNEQPCPNREHNCKNQEKQQKDNNMFRLFYKIQNSLLPLVVYSEFELLTMKTTVVKQRKTTNALVA